MITYSFLQAYWWFLVSLLGGLLVFLLFVQGANSLIFSIGDDEEEKSLIVNSTGRKWEFTFTTLVTFGGAFFASFPLFYSTSFGGAYWMWMLILVSFVLQAVAYEFQSKPGNVLGKDVYRRFLVFNGFLGPFLLGTTVATFFTGAAFMVDKGNIAGETLTPVISSWGNAWHGLDALVQPWNWVLGFAVFFLARVLGGLYLVNNLGDNAMRVKARRHVVVDTIPFLVFFLAFVDFLFFKDGYAVADNGAIVLEAHKYWHNLLAQPVVSILLLLGVALVLHGIIATLWKRTFTRGIWTTGAGTVLAVLAIFLLAGWNDTAYYPSSIDLQSSLTTANSCSSFFTLRAMAVVSLLIPFVLAYIVYAWRAMDRRSLTREELNQTEHKY